LHDLLSIVCSVSLAVSSLVIMWNLLVAQEPWCSELRFPELWLVATILLQLVAVGTLVMAVRDLFP
jgi:flagellar biosynthesis component FlhA